MADRSTSPAAESVPITDATAETQYVAYNDTAAKPSPTAAAAANATQNASYGTPATSPPLAPVVPAESFAWEQVSASDATSSFPNGTAAPGSENSRRNKHTVMRHADRLNTAFVYTSIPLTVILGILVVALYASSVIHARVTGFIVCGYCAGASVFLTMMLILLHLTSYTNPTEQRLIIRILLMVPIYAVDSLAAYTAPKHSSPIGLVRDTYEAYVIYMFFRLLMMYLGGEHATVRLWAETKPEMEHLFPLNYCCKPLPLNAKTLRFFQVCLVQYMVINPLLTLIALPLILTGNYNEADYSPTGLNAWFMAIRFVSVSFAFTSLVYFFFGSKHLMMDKKPLGKFAAIKTVVFVSFWQTVLLGLLNHFKVIPHTKDFNSSEVSSGLNNFCLCVEMFLICLAHKWVFPDTPYLPDDKRRRPLQCWAVKHAFAVSDVIEETTQTLMTPLRRNKTSPSYEEDAPQPLPQPSVVSS